MPKTGWAYGECSKYGSAAYYNIYGNCSCMTGYIFGTVSGNPYCVSYSMYCYDKYGLAQVGII